MRFSLTPLSGRQAFFWAISWFSIATAVTFTLWKPVVHLSPFFAYFAATALIAARAGARMGILCLLTAMVIMFSTGYFPLNEILVRSLTLTANSLLVIWLGSRLRTEARESSEYQSGINEAVSDFVWTTSPSFDTTFINQRCEEYLGRSLRALQNGGWKGVVAEDDLPHVIAAFQQAAHEHRPIGFDLRMHRHDGVLRWFHGRVAPILNAKGEIVRMIGTSTDVDDQKRVEMEREGLLVAERKAREDAEQASRTKDEFLSTLSHELRTPLNAIMGWVYIVKSERLEGKELGEALEIIEKNARAQLRLIEDLLEMSRVITGKIRLQVQNVELAGVVEAAVESVKVSAETKGVKIHSITDPRASLIRADPDRLQQVMWNLLINAIKFTPKGGRVEVALERAGSHAKITVSDSGIGIDPAFVPHVFERFRQEDSSSTRSYEGLGLGLAIVKQLVEIQGGYVEARSEGRGHGATFCVFLPLPASNSVEIAPTADKPRLLNGDADSTLKNLRVLVVDDDQDARGLVARILSRHGAEVTTASNTREALSILQELQFHTLISDIGMPIEDGCELIRHVRLLKPGQGGQIPAIALTAFARNEERLRAIQAGFDVFLPKPVDAAELTAMVGRCASRAK